MKYCLLGLLSSITLFVSFLATNELSETAVDSINETTDVGHSKNADLYTWRWWPYEN